MPLSYVTGTLVKIGQGASLHLAGGHPVGLGAPPSEHLHRFSDRCCGRRYRVLRHRNPGFSAGTVIIGALITLGGRGVWTIRDSWCTTSDELTADRRGYTARGMTRLAAWTALARAVSTSAS